MNTLCSAQQEPKMTGVLFWELRSMHTGAEGSQPLGGSALGAQVGCNVTIEASADKCTFIIRSLLQVGRPRVFMLSPSLIPHPSWFYKGALVWCSSLHTGTHLQDGRPPRRQHNGARKLEEKLRTWQLVLPVWTTSIFIAFENAIMSVISTDYTTFFIVCINRHGMMELQWM